MTPQATIPARITPEIQVFCRRLVAGAGLIVVPIRPAAGALADQAFSNLKLQVAGQGGKVQLGWAIREMPGWFLEAAFHGVWIAPNGQAIDITPRTGEENTLFLPDPARFLDGERPADRFQALSPSPEVQSVVRMAEMHARLRSEAESLARRSQVRARPAGRNDPCPCGSGLKFKKCCGRASG